MKALLLLGLLLAAQDDPAGRIPGLIEKLNSDTIEERDEATRQLKTIGKPAVRGLQARAGDPDAELAARIRSLLDAIAADADPLRNPNAPILARQAPAEFKVRFTTSRGDFVVQVTRDWAPLGADRFHNLVLAGYYDGCRFFRVIPNFMCQFGIHGNPAVSAAWKQAKIQDDPGLKENTRGRLSFATAGKNTRTTQLFINVRDNRRLDGMGFAAFGEVTEGLEVVDQFYSGYGEGAPSGQGPQQARIQAEGNAYLDEGFEKLDFIEAANIID